LLANRPKGALTFAGVYRIIDFTLSRLRACGIDHVGIPIQYLPASLIEHVGVGEPWDFHGHGRVLKVMPPFVGIESTSWYRGTGDAILRNWNFVEDTCPEHVLVISGEHVHNLDIQAAMKVHLESGADATFLTVQLPPNRLSPRFGYIHATGEGRITAYLEKPGEASGLIVSTGAYILKREVLLDLLRANELAESHNLAADILAPAVADILAVEARMDTCTWEYMTDPEDYLEVHLRLAACGHEFDFRRWEILTNLEYRSTATRCSPHFESSAEVSEALLSPGCIIGGQVEKSVLSPGVTVASGASVKRSVIHHDTKIEKNASLERVLIDKDVVIGEGAVVGGEDGSLTILGKGCQISPGVVVPAGTHIPPGAVVRPKVV
jgi:glucose-1-phosphate adenylyltransferase